MDPLRLLLAAFATYRLAGLFSLDDGPYMIFARLRKFLGAKAAGKSECSTWHSLALLFQCPFCLGVWIAIFMLIPLYVQNEFTNIFLYVFAISGFQTFFETIGRRFL